MPRTLDGLDEDEDQQPQGADASSPHLHTVSTGDTAQPQFQLMHADAERINEEQTATETRPFLLYPASSSPGISFALTAARCTSQTSFNPLRYFSLLSETYQPQPQSRSHTPALCETPAQNHSYERAILSWMEDDIRERAWRLLERSYISCGTGWAGNILGLGLGSRVNGGNEDRVEKYVSGKGKKVDLDRGLVLFR
ncbi:hypothetical protein I317_02044 [Kwoniella heveanensis CBS 569]|nr:hypothetical protein I317_02044 [Kwoniella heveanensis CBS 569]